MDETCIHCEESIHGERFVYANGPVAHRECMLRQVVGSVAHQLRTCSCYVDGSTEGDAPELTRREAADAAARMFQHLHGVKKQ